MPFLPSDGSALFDLSEQAFEYIEAQVEGVDVQTALLNERVDPDGSLVPCVDVGWQIVGRPGLLYCHPKYVATWADIATREILFKKEKVLAIYDGLPEAPWLVGNLPPTLPPGVITGVA